MECRRGVYGLYLSHDGTGQALEEAGGEDPSGKKTAVREPIVQLRVNCCTWSR
jgi:hypothetical protein